MNRIKEVENINKRELELGLAGTSASWHSQFEKAPWIYVGHLPFELSEGDIICVFSQYGEVEDIHLVREDDTGKSRGFAFIKYEDSRSAVLAVDNFCGAKICGRPISVDHVENYRVPKNILENAKDGKDVIGPGHAYHDTETKNAFSIGQGQDLFARPSAPSSEDDNSSKEKKKKRKKKDKHSNKEEKKKRRKKHDDDDEHGRKKRSKRSKR